MGLIGQELLFFCGVNLLFAVWYLLMVIWDISELRRQGRNGEMQWLLLRELLKSGLPVGIGIVGVARGLGGEWPVGETSAWYQASLVLGIALPCYATLLSILNLFDRHRRSIIGRDADLRKSDRVRIREILDTVHVEVYGVWANGVGASPLDLSFDFKTVLPRLRNWNVLGLQGENSTQAKFQSDVALIREIDILYIAAHADGESLALADGDIDYRKLANIYRSSIMADVVCLSTCDTDALPQLLLTSGASAVVYFRSSVEDSEAIEFFKQFFSALATSDRFVTLWEAQQRAKSHVTLSTAAASRLAGDGDWTLARLVEKKRGPRVTLGV